MMTFFHHAKVQAPLARLRTRVSSIWRGALQLVGRYEPISVAERAVVKGDATPFKGDIPVYAGKLHSQTRLRFSSAPAPLEDVDNLVFTSVGAGWRDGVLYEKYCASKPGLKMILSGAGASSAQRVPAGIVIQSEHTDTFGDWMAEYLAPLARAGVLDAPVFLPKSIASKPYAIRDIERLGLNAVVVDTAVMIEKAKVIRQPKTIRYWTREDVDALGRFIKAAPRDPAPGSIVYLSRHGEKSGVATRTHKNELLETLITAKGGKVLRTSEVGYEDYVAAAQFAETVVFDHGSAGYNMIYWRPKRVIEITTDDWWMNAFLFFSDAMGVRDYTIIRVDLGAARARDMLSSALDRPMPVGGVR